MMSLNDWISQIRPLEQELKTLKGNTQTIKTILEHNSKELSLKSVRIGGSLSKGTITRGRLEADIIFIINKKDWSNKLKEKIAQVLEDNLECKTNVRKISIETRITKNIGTLSFDVIPALEVNSPKQMAIVKNSDFYRGSTTIFQVKYFKKHKTSFPELGDQVRLLKLWKSSQHVDFSSFLMELIAIEAIYRHNLQKVPSDEALVASFKVLKRILQGSAIYPRNWVFSEKDVTAKKKNKMLVIDPGDVSNNIVPNLGKKQIQKLYQILNSSIKAALNKEYSSLFH